MASRRTWVGVPVRKRAFGAKKFAFVLTVVAAILMLVLPAASAGAAQATDVELERPNMSPAFEGEQLCPDDLSCSQGIGYWRGRGVEPAAGNWHTWVLTSGSQVVPPAPPNKQATRDEIQVLKQLAKERDSAVRDRIAFWNGGAPVYRWNEMAVSEMAASGLNTLVAGRGLALVHAAVSDATIAAWNAKYQYNRLRPSRFDRSLSTEIAVPASPSYPAEHAVAAGAASEVLAYLFPNRADYFREKALEASNAFLSAGVNYPSDVDAGLALGREVAALVIERGKNDGSNLPWGGTIPTGPGLWTGENPVLPQAANWKPWALTSSSEFRPGPPPAYDSPELAAEMDELRNFQRTPKTNTLAFFWEYGAGGARNYWYWNQQLSNKLFEYGLSSNPPRAARAYALQNIAYHDAVAACWDAKYTYWAIRPFQLDPAFKTLFVTPNHPSYPSAHSCLSTAAADILGYLFPYSADSFNALADEAGESRIWAGLHFRSDISAGEQLGHQVAAKAIELARADDSVSKK